MGWSGDLGRFPQCGVRLPHTDQVQHRVVLQLKVQHMPMVHEATRVEQPVGDGVLPLPNIWLSAVYSALQNGFDHNGYVAADRLDVPLLPRGSPANASF